MISLPFFFLIIGLFFLSIELQHLLKPTSPLKLKATSYSFNQTKEGLEITTILEINNPHKRMEVMIPKLDVNPVLLGKADLTGIRTTTQVIANHPDEKTRRDGYWVAYIVKSKSHTNVEIKVVINDYSIQTFKDEIESIWLDIEWINYGPFGRLEYREGIALPIKTIQAIEPSDAYFYAKDGYKLLPLKTHILGGLDDVYEVLRYYSEKLIQEGDVLTLGETPLALMQGRYIDPSIIKPSWIARLLCRVFHPTSSLATACGLQVLINAVGPSRVLLAWIIGVFLKIIGIKGGFYRIAGKQARLIDDVTGTTPPYDKTIVLGPNNPEEVCKRAAQELGIDIAIVDVNDLGGVAVLASSSDCNQSFIKKALKTNPAGNANQHTPLVLVRPS